MQRLGRKALELTSAQNPFLTKRLNVWVNADSAWLNMVDWEKCANPKLNEADFKSEECFGAVDLASKIDIAAFIRLYRRQIAVSAAALKKNPKVTHIDHYYLFTNFYLPEETVEENENSQYEGWVKRGLLTATDGNVIDYDAIEEDVKETHSTKNLKEFAFDPYQATQFSLRMADEGIEMVQYGATVKNFSEPMKELEALIIDRRFHHTGNDVMTWMISNVVCHTDVKDNIFPRKELPQNKIDGVVAAIMALGIATLKEQEDRPYKTRGIIQL